MLVKSVVVGNEAVFEQCGRRDCVNTKGIITYQTRTLYFTSQLRRGRYFKNLHNLNNQPVPKKYCSYCNYWHVFALSGVVVGMEPVVTFFNERKHMYKIEVLWGPTFVL